MLNKITVRTSQEPHHVSPTEPNRLMLIAETVPVYWSGVRLAADSQSTSKSGYQASFWDP
jgi:hypothetical protein